MSRPAPRPTGRRDLNEGSLAWNLFALGAPLMAQMSVQAVYNLTDAFWLGKLSPLAITAPGVSMPFVFIVFALAAGFGNGGAALVAQYAGAGRHDDADRAAGQTLIFLLAVSLLFAGIILCLTRPLLVLVRVPENVAAVTNGYLRIFILGTPFVACTVAYGSALRALGDTLTVVYIGAASSLLNLVLDPILIVPASNYFFTVMMVLSAAFYGSGHTRPVMVVSLLRQWALRMPMAYFFGYILGWGILGIYAGMGLANILCAVLMLWVFLRGNWTRAVIPASIEEEAEIQAETEVETLDMAGSD